MIMRPAARYSFHTGFDVAMEKAYRGGTTLSRILLEQRQSVALLAGERVVRQPPLEHLVRVRKLRGTDPLAAVYWVGFLRHTVLPKPPERPPPQLLVPRPPRELLAAVAGHRAPDTPEPLPDRFSSVVSLVVKFAVIDLARPDVVPDVVVGPR